MPAGLVAAPGADAGCDPVESCPIGRTRVSGTLGTLWGTGMDCAPCGFSAWPAMYSGLRAEARRGRMLPYVIEVDGRFAAN